MLQPREQPDLSTKSFRTHGVADVRPEHLDGDWPLVPHIAREKDDRHATVVELALDDVSIAERALNPIGESVHALQLRLRPGRM